MNIDEFMTTAKNQVGFPDEAGKRLTLASLPCFKKHEAKYYVNVSDMTLADWWDAFNEYMTQAV